MAARKSKRYAFGSARDLYARNVHPRVMLGPDDVVRLREQVKTGAGKKIMAALRTKVRRLAGFLHGADDVVIMMRGDGTHNSLGCQIGRCVSDIALTAVIDEDEYLIDAMRRLYGAIMSVPKEQRTGWAGIANLALPYDILHDHLEAKLRRGIVKSLQVGAKAAIRATAHKYFHNAAGNMTLGTTLSAVAALLAIQGDSGATKTQKDLAYLVTCFEATLGASIHPNGYPEEDIGYGTGVTAGLAQTAEWLRRAGLYDIYAACPKFAKFGQAMLHFVQPWGEDLSNTGDHGDDFGQREFILARMAAETGDPSVLWLLGTLHYHHGKVHPENRMPEVYVEVPLRKGFRTHASHRSLLMLDELQGEKSPGKLGVPTAYCDPRRGIVSFRDGWDADDTFLWFDGSQRSPAGQGHAHASAGHFGLSAVGEYFSVGCGRYNNEQSCMSVVLIDGKSGRSTHGEWHCVRHHGVLTTYRPGEFVDFAGADSSHQHDCYWAWRHVGFVKGPGARGYAWTIDDINKNSAWAEYWWQMQSSPENTIKTYRNHATITGWRYGNMLDVHFALPAASEYPEPHTLTVEQDIGLASAYKYLNCDVANHDRPFTGPLSHVKRYERPADMVHGPVYARPRLLGKVGGLNGRIMSIMIPRAKGEPKPRVRRLKCIPASLAVQVTFAEIEDLIIFAYEHDLLEAADIVARGHWCVVRRCRKTGRVLAHEIERGQLLQVGGKALPIRNR